MEDFIVIIIVAASVFYLGRLFYKAGKKEDSSSCGCGSCSMAEQCAGGDNEDPVRNCGSRH